VRKIHRLFATAAIVFGLYVAGSGTFLQLIDLQTLLGHAPATNANLEAIREGLDGPPNFQVLVTADYAAADLPSDLNLDSTLETVVSARYA
jgi:hypothetical protein